MNDSMIPKGLYCYTTIKIIMNKDGFKMITEPCPYFTYLKGEGFCLRDNYEIDDQCKMCGINDINED